jgi:hypothetical protein
MRGAIPPLPNTPTWRVLLKKHRDNITFTFTHWLAPDVIVKRKMSAPAVNRTSDVCSMGQTLGRTI